MSYTEIHGINNKLYMFKQYLAMCDDLKCEGISQTIAALEEEIIRATETLKTLKPDPVMTAKEPDDYDEIRELCAPAKMLYTNLPSDFKDKLSAAILSRFAGCTLGAPVEGWTVDQIENYAKELGLPIPLTDYWTDTPLKGTKRYIYSKFEDYTKPYLNSVPCDDDVGFTILSLLIAEEGKGHELDTEDVAKAWLKYITEAYTAEQAAMDNLKAGVAPKEAAIPNNPYIEWIGADIRCDGYGYMAPGNPELAAKLAYEDAYLSHRRNGIYGSMFFAATISAAFALGDPILAIEEGLKYIPQECRLADDVRWALDIRKTIKNARHAAELVDERFKGMHIVHTLNNACLVVFALELGGKDIGKVFSNAVFMAHDADCTAATAGSIAGACYGMEALEKHWYDVFNNKVLSFYNGPREYQIDDIIERYYKLAEKSIDK
ncbi:MAG: ADP-ribosylglycohydrolase family protein [Eubacteriales bacterium]|nr:ADP-ribosylglycohydrolase family protein [Eubacteriales bacterium]MDD4475468.1 ADP-ribosylglycohydrolase family protein [Eubacteriales bacterium]